MKINKTVINFSVKPFMPLIDIISLHSASPKGLNNIIYYLRIVTIPFMYLYCTDDTLRQVQYFERRIIAKHEMDCFRSAPYIRNRHADLK